MIEARLGLDCHRPALERLTRFLDEKHGRNWAMCRESTEISAYFLQEAAFDTRIEYGKAKLGASEVKGNILLALLNCHV
jgi:hypothetical protein